AGPAVAAAARGDAQRDALREHRAAAVARLGAHVGLDQAADRALRVVDRRAERGDLPVAQSGRGAAAEHPLTDGGLAHPGDPDALAVPDRHHPGARARLAAVVLDQRVVVAGETAADRGAHLLPAPAVGE